MPSSNNRPPFLTTYWTSPPGYRALRSWRANDLAVQVIHSLEEGDVQRANELAAASLQLEAHSSENRRLFAEHFEESDPEGALLHSHELIAHPDATTNDLYR